MRTPEELRKRLEARWKNQRRNWLLGQGEWPLQFSTEPPKEADVLADWTRFDRWLAQWRDVSQANRGVVRYDTRIWSRLGEQKIPCAWQSDTPEGVAAELGQASRWSQAKRRFDELATWTGSESWRMELSRHFDVLADFGDMEFERLCKVVMWLREHPSSNLYPRQLPVPNLRRNA
jgi:hypothetical protein